ncbi:MAG: hypothetical protein OXH92_14215 [Bryobacterales bacterium]|nr:hypothetical protein [Bryobacterales bacterium]
MQASFQADWSRYHVSAPPPNALSKRIAISWDIPEQQLMISENCFRLTPSLLTASVKMSPRGSGQSRRPDRLGWG